MTKHALVPALALVLASGCTRSGSETDSPAAPSEQTPAATSQTAAPGPEAEPEGTGPEEGEHEPVLVDPLAIDRSRPDVVAAAIFDTAWDGQMGRLAGLCDPDGTADAVATRLCAMDYDDKHDFLVAFRNGRVNGPAILAADGRTAEVPVLYGQDGTTEATLVFVKRPTGWYLQRF